MTVNIAKKLTANEVLAKFDKLEENIKVYVPATININEEIDNSEFVEYIAEKLSGLFGGATIHNNQMGCWISEKMGLVKEKTTIVEAFAGMVTGEAMQEVVELCNWLKEAMKQECVALEYNGKLHFI